MVSTIIFDFDGVLVDTFEFHRIHLEKFGGIELPAHTYRDMHNGNFFAHNVNPLKDVDWQKYVEFILEDYRLLRINHQILFALKNLSQNYNLHIVSPASDKLLEEFLVRTNDVRKYFGIVIGSDKERCKVKKFDRLLEKEGLAKEDVIFVTDTLGDILDGNKIGIATIAVEGGFHSKEKLLEGNPKAIISNLGMLESYL